MTTANDIVDHEGLKQSIYPMDNHPLYGNAATFIDTDYLLPAALADFTNETDFEEDTTSLEICPACFFNTSGTTNRSKKIPFSDADLARQKVHEAISFKKLGMVPGDGVMSLGAPLPSISGWAIVNGSEHLGAKALNTSQLDYDDIIDRGRGKQATFVIGTPLVVKEIGKAIIEEYGPMSEVLPNMRTGVIFGDVLPDALRAELKEIWGFEHVLSLYGTVEADVVATECVDYQGEMLLMSERLYFEFLPESELAKERLDLNYVAKSMTMDQVPNRSFGEILISDLSREVLPLIRYRIGDVIEVHRSTRDANANAPTISVLGRSKNTVMLENIALYEMQLNNALTTWLGNDLLEWKLTENEAAADHHYTLEVQLVKGRELPINNEAVLFKALRDQRNELTDVNLAKEIHVQQIIEFAKVEVTGDIKAARIILLPQTV
ncbi:MAG: GH3 auxin-responsive promoter family protein [Algicola sp.]|nr:GH3 auxin-responsive promoter family protein [Algicola sp.]